jgi:hypothetical protein
MESKVTCEKMVFIQRILGVYISVNETTFSNEGLHIILVCKYLKGNKGVVIVIAKRNKVKTVI